MDRDGNARFEQEQKRFLDVLLHPSSIFRPDDGCSCTLKGFAVKTEEGGLTIVTINQVFQHADDPKFAKRLSGAMPVGHKTGERKKHHCGQVEYAFFG
ncbi:MAG TPA: hypothetical protein VM492_12290 [Sumerlaeia bacterium]|nr:hypothetical protein [Sumerlaeia bacterium]